MEVNTHAKVMKAALMVLRWGILSGWGSLSKSEIREINKLIAGVPLDLIDNWLNGMEHMGTGSAAVVEFYRKEYPGQYGMSIYQVDALCDFIDEHGLAMELDNFLDEELR